MDGQCRKCLLRESFPEDYEKYVATLLQKIPSSRKAPEGICELRLSLCRECDQLNNGTCMGCGCLVELKAAYRGEHCPFGKWRE